MTLATKAASGNSRNRMNDSIKVILAPASPRRRQLLAAAGIAFEVVESHMPEQHNPGESPRDYALRMARDKARAVSSRFPDAIVVGANTISVRFSHPGKARRCHRRAPDARDAICAHSHGRDCLCAGARRNILESSPVESQVTFRKLTKAEIDAYIATDEPFDKAGAYGIRESAAASSRTSKDRATT